VQLLTVRGSWSASRRDGENWYPRLRLLVLARLHTIEMHHVKLESAGSQRANGLASVDLARELVRHGLYRHAGHFGAGYPTPRLVAESA
jgi:hypothetical protein